MQELLLYLVAISSTLVFVSSSAYFYKKIKLDKIRNYDPIILVLSFIFLAFTMLVLFFAINPQSFSKEKFIAVLSLLILIKTIIIITILSKIQKNNNILYPISFLLLSLIPAIINVTNIHITIPMSMLVIIMTFLSFTEDHKSHIPLLIGYSSISLMFYILSFIFPKATILFSAISLSIFLVFISEFFKFLTTKREVHIHVNKKSDSRMISFLKHLIFVIIITNFVFVGTVAVHELGHAISAQVSDCEETKIVYEMTGLPHTEITCSNTSHSNNWTLLGIFLPMLIALLLMFGDGESIKEIALEIIGFSLMISYLDFQTLGATKTFSTIILIIGVVLASFGLALLIKSRAD